MVKHRCLLFLMPTHTLAASFIKIRHYAFYQQHSRRAASISHLLPGLAPPSYRTRPYCLYGRSGVCYAHQMMQVCP